MGHCLSVPPHEELVSTCHHRLALHSSWATGPCSGGPAETRLEGGRVRELAAGQRVGCLTSLTTYGEKGYGRHRSQGEGCLRTPSWHRGTPRMGLGAHPLSREGSCSEGRGPRHLPDEVATELGFKE